MNINGAQYLSENLSWTDMTGSTTLVVLAIFFILGALALRHDEKSPAPWSVSLVAMAVATPILWAFFSFLQNSYLGTELTDLKKFERLYEIHEELTPHPAMIELNEYKEEMVNTMKARGDFGEYEPIFEKATDLSNVYRYTDDPYKKFYIITTFKSCFKTDDVPEDMQHVLSVFPFDYREVLDIWERHLYKHGVWNPACYKENFAKNLD